MIKMTIKVTKDILRRSAHCGILNNGKTLGRHCAISVAVREVFGNVSTSVSGIVLIDRRNNYNYHYGRIYADILLPIKAQKFISVFDSLSPENRLLMPELEFDVNVPDSTLEMIGNIEEVRELIANSPTMEMA